MMPRYPIYVISKGRADNCLTARFLVRDKVPFKLVIEPQEQGSYARYKEHLAILPFSDLGLGSIPARNWVWEHAKESGAERHWILDDNIRSVQRSYKSKRILCDSGPAMCAIEDFTDRYENVAISGMNYSMFGLPNAPPFVRNVHVYSFLLIRNDLPYRWRGRYNEDTDLCLQVLSNGWCTLQFSVFLAEKMMTMKMKGGNSDQLYRGDGRLKMARSLERVWPYVVTTKRKFRRPQHSVKSSWDYFDTPLVRKKNIEIPTEPNEYGLGLVKIQEPKSDRIRKIFDEYGGSKTERIDEARAAQLVPSKVEIPEPVLISVERFAELITSLGLDAAALVELADFGVVNHKKGNAESRKNMQPLVELETRWYAALEKGEPDWGVYAEAEYLSETWLCWLIYSRKYLRMLAKWGDPILQNVSSVVDLGCGMGATTCALKSMFPDARVVGTNFGETYQASMGKLLGEEHGFEILPDVASVGVKGGLVFASEYFEHIPAPVSHLDEVIKELEPRIMVTANAFGQKAIGHFDTYTVDEQEVDSKRASLLFNKRLRGHGYVEKETGFWNNRPAVWVKAGAEYSAARRKS